MQLLSEIIIRNPVSGAAIQLLQGDCTAIPKEHNADILVVSAFPNDYTPLPGSLMYALFEKGIDVGELSKNKAVDLVSQLGCWMSQPLTDEEQQKFNIKQILCFEPSRQGGAPEDVVGNIFRCINNFAFDDDNNAIVMPLLATGKQRVPMETMLPAMLDASIFWLETGIPLDYIKLVVKNETQAQLALPLFESIRQAYESKHAAAADQGQAANGGGGKGQGAARALKKGVATRNGMADGSGDGTLEPAGAGKGIDGGAGAGEGTVSRPGMVAEPQPKPSVGPNGGLSQAGTAATKPAFDFFISYSHKQTLQVAELVTALKEKNPQFKVFYDKSSIPPGGQWIRQISEAIQRSKCVICILSPEYRDSDVCWDEFQCAKAKEYRTKQSVIKTINFLQDPDMPLIMSVYSYIDCTEGDIAKLRDAVKDLCIAGA